MFTQHYVNYSANLLPMRGPILVRACM